MASDSCLDRVWATARLPTESADSSLVVWGLLHPLKNSLLVTGLPSSSHYWECQQEVHREPELYRLKLRARGTPRGVWSGGCSAILSLQGVLKS